MVFSDLEKKPQMYTFSYVLSYENYILGIEKQRRRVCTAAPLPDEPEIKLAPMAAVTMHRHCATFSYSFTPFTTLSVSLMKPTNTFSPSQSPLMSKVPYSALA